MALKRCLPEAMLVTFMLLVGTPADCTQAVSSPLRPLVRRFPFENKKHQTTLTSDAHIDEHTDPVKEQPAALAQTLARSERVQEYKVSQETKAGKSSEFIQVGALARLKMMLHAWMHPLSVAAIITTIALQLSPMPSSLEIKRDRDIKRYDGYPYVAVLANATQWCLYGSFAVLVLHDMSHLTMILANGPGVICGIFYVVNYLRFAPKEDARSSALKRYLVFGLCLLLVNLAACVLLQQENAVNWLGLIGSILGLNASLSPFKTLPEVLRTRSTKSWPLDLCLWSLIQSVAMVSFGFASNDVWVWALNLFCVLGSAIQLSLIAAFWERPCGHSTTC